MDYVIKTMTFYQVILSLIKCPKHWVEYFNAYEMNFNKDEVIKFLKENYGSLGTPKFFKKTKIFKKHGIMHIDSVKLEITFINEIFSKYVGEFKFRILINGVLLDEKISTDFLYTISEDFADGFDITDHRKAVGCIRKI